MWPFNLVEKYSIQYNNKLCSEEYATDITRFVTSAYMESKYTNVTELDDRLTLCFMIALRKYIPHIRFTKQDIIYAVLRFGIEKIDDLSDADNDFNISRKISTMATTYCAYFKSCPNADINVLLKSKFKFASFFNVVVFKVDAIEGAARKCIDDYNAGYRDNAILQSLKDVSDKH